MKSKRFLSFFLSLIFVFSAAVWPNSSLTKTVSAAFPGEEVTTTLNGSPYTFVMEPGFKTYNEEDPQQILLYTTSTLDNYYPYDSHLAVGGIKSAVAAVDDGTNGRIEAATSANNIATLRYLVVNSSSATVDQQAVLNNWGVTRMLGLWMEDDVTDGTFTGVASDSVYNYYYNLKFIFNRSYDLTKFTHLYLDFWVSSAYVTGTDGYLNVALVDTSVSSLDGLEFNIPMHKLRLDPDSNTACTGHTYRLDLRALASSVTYTGGTVSLNNINGVTFRYLTSVNDKTQYKTGTTPKIYFGKMVAYTETDNLHPAIHWHNGATGTEYSDTDMPEPQQGGVFAVAGANSWNKSSKLVFPMWRDGNSSRVMGLDWGDRTTTGIDYYFDLLDLGPWRWQRSGATDANTDGNKPNFPTSPLTGGGGSYSISVKRWEPKWLSDTTHGSFTVS